MHQTLIFTPGDLKYTTQVTVNFWNDIIILLNWFNWSTGNKALTNTRHMGNTEIVKIKCIIMTQWQTFHHTGLHAEQCRLTKYPRYIGHFFLPCKQYLYKIAWKICKIPDWSQFNINWFLNCVGMYRGWIRDRKNMDLTVILPIM